MFFRFDIVRSVRTEELEVSGEVGVEGLYVLRLRLRLRKRRVVYSLGLECRGGRSQIRLTDKTMDIMSEYP